MEIKLRKAKDEDITFLFDLRNQPSTYKYSKNNRLVEWQEHINWITPVIKGKTVKNLFVVEADGKKAGQTRIDINGGQAEVHISLMPEFQGKGIAALAIKMAMNKIKKEKKIKIFRAEIHQENIPSQKMFEKLGFQFQSQKDIWKKYAL